MTSGSTSNLETPLELAQALLEYDFWGGPPQPASAAERAQQVGQKFRTLTAETQVSALLLASQSKVKNFSSTQKMEGPLQEVVLKLMEDSGHRKALAPMLRLLSVSPGLRSAYLAWAKEDLDGFLLACAGTDPHPVRSLLPEIIVAKYQTTPASQQQSLQQWVLQIPDEAVRQAALGGLLLALPLEDMDILATLKELASQKQAKEILLGRLQREAPEQLAYTFLAEPSLFRNGLIWPEFFLKNWTLRNSSKSELWLTQAKSQRDEQLSFWIDTVETALLALNFNPSNATEAAGQWRATPGEKQEKLLRHLMDPELPSSEISARFQIAGEQSTADQFSQFLHALPDAPKDSSIGNFINLLLKSRWHIPTEHLLAAWSTLEPHLIESPTFDLADGRPKQEADRLLAAASPAFRKLYSQRNLQRAIKDEDWATALRELTTGADLASIGEREIGDLTNELASRYPEGVRQVVDTLPEGTPRDMMTVNLVGCWVKNDPTAAEHWVASLPSGTTQRLAYYRLHVGMAAIGDDLAAIRYLKKAIEDKRKEDGLPVPICQTYFRDLAKLDPAYAQLLFQESGLQTWVLGDRNFFQKAALDQKGF